MRANELMVGDLFRVNRDGLCIKKDTIVQIRGIDGDNRFEKKGLVGCANCRPMDEKQYDGGIWVDYLSPILLTPEILEKNGFKYDGSGQRSMMLMTPYGESGTRWNIYVGLKHKTIDVFSAPPVEKSPGWRKYNKVYLEVCGCYVHELQHALRICGIDKEVVV